MKPAYKNQYQQTIDTILANKSNAQFRDIWLYNTFRTFDWTEELTTLYERYEHERLYCENLMRKQQSDYCDVNTTWQTFTVDLLEPLLGPIDDNHTKIFRLARFV